MQKLSGLLLLALPLAGFGACERADIEFYLSKNFTPEQITSICAAPAEGQSPQNVIDKPQLSASQLDELLLRLGDNIKIENVKIVGNTLQFEQKLRLKYGAKTISGEVPDLNITRVVSMPLGKLKVLTANRGMRFFSDASISLGDEFSSQIKDLDKLSIGAQKAVAAYLKDEGQQILKLTMRLSGNVDVAVQDLNTLADSL